MLLYDILKSKMATATHWDPDANEGGELSKISISRITKEFDEITRNPTPGIRVIIGDSIKWCYVIITGPSETAYAGAPFLIKIVFNASESYKYFIIWGSIKIS